MKIHVPAFIVGFIIFVLPFLGLPSIAESILVSVFGVVIMIVTTKFNKVVDRVDSQQINSDVTNSQPPQN